MDRVRDLLLRLYGWLDRSDWIPRLVARVSLGLMFVGGAIYKVGHLDDFIAYFRSLHIPAPGLQAPFVVSVELFGGLALILGLATRPAAVMLAGTMVVALGTAVVPEYNELHPHSPIHANWDGLQKFFFLPEWLVLVVLAWMVFAGAGRVSLDQRIRLALERRKAPAARADGQPAVAAK